MVKHRVIHRPAVVKQGFSSDERRRILDAADAQRIHGYPDWFVGFLCRFFMLIGGHTALLYRAADYDPHIEGTSLVWTRPKLVKQQEVMVVPIPTDLQARMPEFLDLDFPSSPRRYWDILDAVGKAAGVKSNFLRYRHMAFWIWINEIGMSVPDACRLGGTTPEVLQIYAVRTSEAIAEDMRRRGW